MSEFTKIATITFELVYESEGNERDDLTIEDAY